MTSAGRFLICQFLLFLFFFSLFLFQRKRRDAGSSNSNLWLSAWRLLHSGLSIFAVHNGDCYLWGDNQQEVLLRISTLQGPSLKFSDYYIFIDESSYFSHVKRQLVFSFTLMWLEWSSVFFFFLIVLSFSLHRGCSYPYVFSCSR